MFKRVLAEYPDSSDVPAALEGLAEMYAGRGDYVNAEACYRQCLSSGRGLTTGYVDLALAEVLIASGRTDALDEVQSLLDAVAARPFLFKIHKFRFCRAHALLAARCGRPDVAREYAKHALEIAADQSPDLPRHPTVGLVCIREEKLRELRKLAGES